MSVQINFVYGESKDISIKKNNIDVMFDIVNDLIKNKIEELDGSKDVEYKNILSETIVFLMKMRSELYNEIKLKNNEVLNGGN